MPYPDHWPTPYPDDDGQGRPPTVAALTFAALIAILALLGWLAVNAGVGA